MVAQEREDTLQPPQATEVADDERPPTHYNWPRYPAVSPASATGEDAAKHAMPSSPGSKCRRRSLLADEVVDDPRLIPPPTCWRLRQPANRAL
eukprot:15564416-Heterocapsa_arctica.AAC.1